MGFVSILSFAQQLVRTRVQPNDTVVDATLGTGNDSLFLASLLGKKGRLFAFDIQKEALDATHARLFSAAKRGEISKASLFFFLDSHAHWLERIPADAHRNIGAVMFNLGYLPGGSSSKIITHPETTLTALRAAATNLRIDGILTVVLYPGHAGGDDEAIVVDNWAKHLPQEHFDVLKYQFTNRAQTSPFLVAILRKK